MIITDKVYIQDLDLDTYFNRQSKSDSKTSSTMMSYLFLVFGMIVGIVFMRLSVVEDTIVNRVGRIDSANSIIDFHNEYNSNKIDATGLYLELYSLYEPTTVSLFSVNLNGDVEIIFLHQSPDLKVKNFSSMIDEKLDRGATIMVESDKTLYIYKVEGVLENYNKNPR